MHACTYVFIYIYIYNFVFPEVAPYQQIPIISHPNTRIYQPAAGVFITWCTDQAT